MSSESLYSVFSPIGFTFIESKSDSSIIAKASSPLKTLSIAIFADSTNDIVCPVRKAMSREFFARM